MITIENIEALSGFVGKTLGPSDAVTITQDMIDRFGDVTGDRQWIHCDPERAKREAPGGVTIAHGYLTLSLLASLQATLYTVQNVSRGINYGANRLRFLSPVPVSSRVRLRQEFKAVEPIQGGARLIAESTFEIEGHPKPALVVETIGLFYA